MVQEVVASSDVWLLCNNQLFGWDQLTTAKHALLSESMPYSKRGACNGRKSLSALNQSEDRLEFTRLLLLVLLEFTRYLRATDPRDMIYVARGLSAEEDSSPFLDCSQPIKKLHHQFASYFVSRRLDLEIIKEADLCRSSLSISPWVPDWRFFDDYHKCINFKVFDPRNRLYRAAPGSAFKVLLTDELLHIVPKGAVVNEIISVTPS